MNSAFYSLGKHYMRSFVWEKIGLNLILVKYRLFQTKGRFVEGTNIH